MITLIFLLPNASGLVYAKNLRKWAEKAFASSTLVFHAKHYVNAQAAGRTSLAFEFQSISFHQDPTSL
jgi:hypothetical protein